MTCLDFKQDFFIKRCLGKIVEIVKIVNIVVNIVKMMNHLKKNKILLYFF